MNKRSFIKITVLQLLLGMLLFACATTDTGIESKKEVPESNEAYTGSYEVAPGTDLEISTANGVLYLQTPGQQKVPLQADSGGTFSIPGTDAKVVFEKNESGEINGMVLHQGSNETMARKKVDSTSESETEYIKADRTRADVEVELPAVQSAYENAPNVDENRRAYAKTLFELGNVWQAKEVITPLTTPQSTNLPDLELGARLALLTMDLDKAEILYKRLMELSEKNSELNDKALKGLQLTYFQSNDYTKIRGISFSESEMEESLHFHNFLKKFEGEPYSIEWTSADKTGYMPFLNDITEPGVLPTMKVTVNGHPLEFILDT